MADERTPMSGSYRAVLTFVIGMIVVSFVWAAATKSKSDLAALLWGYTAWLMYKQRNRLLVTIYKMLIGLCVVVGGIGLLVLLVYKKPVYDLTAGEYAGTMLVSLALFVALHSFFRRQLLQQQMSSVTAHSAASAQTCVAKVVGGQSEGSSADLACEAAVGPARVEPSRKSVDVADPAARGAERSAPE